MGYLEKENLILERLRETEYAIFGGSKDDALSFMANSLLAISEYQNITIRGNILKTTHGADTTNKAKERAFKRAAESVDSLNVLCRELGLKPFMSTSRINALGFKTTVGEYTSELFRLRFPQTTT